MAMSCFYRTWNWRWRCFETTCFDWGFIIAVIVNLALVVIVLAVSRTMSRSL
ncbi:hypothetical protein L207DRAFT_513463 [Hyaloscypha variabilis F]|uniref:Uncharacterized protein n=1 Tax=Hyaloscypha variabilis (strain UAMH 11265 / GT02V1 / F) TaxID=1149755 RepID=A0A2J6RKC1_HYAVF|nr:hypothetical protein L207DRAFT_513463 [Hyaloscypha variabilis F]